MPAGCRWQVTGGVPGWQPARCGTRGGLQSWSSSGVSVGLSNLCPAGKFRDDFWAPSITGGKPLLPLGSSFAAPRMLPLHGGSTEGAGARSPFCLGEPLLRDTPWTHTGLPQRLSKPLQLLKTLSKASCSISGTRERERGSKNRGRA